MLWYRKSYSIGPFFVERDVEDYASKFYRSYSSGPLAGVSRGVFDSSLLSASR